MNRKFWIVLDLLSPSYLVLGLLLAFAGPLQAQYCTSNATSTADSDLDAFAFNTINNNTAGICATYSDFTNISTVVNIGNAYTIAVTPGTCGGNFTKHFKTFIDWNGDQDFNDPGEEVFSGGPAQNTQTFTGTVTVPPTAVVGTTRLRCVVEETGSLANVDACGTYTWGETEDYTVIIAPSAPNDIGATAFLAPASGCNLGSDSVSITVTNFGTNTQTAWNVSYSVNGMAPVTEPMTGNLATGQSQNFTFATLVNLSAAGTYTLTAWTSLSTDSVGLNDTTTFTVTSIPSISTFPYIEGFENGDGGWLPGGTNSSWALGQPNKTTIQGAANGFQSYVTGGLGNGSYNSNEDSWVLGPCFDFSSLQNPWISMSVWWHSEDGWDGSNLQASTDFGNTWVTIGQAFDPGNWYNNNSINGQPGGVQEGWSGGAFNSGTGSNFWVTAAHRLDGLAGQNQVRLRITFGADASVQDDGFAFDDIRISEGPVVDLGPDTLICGGDSLFLDAGNFASYSWSTGGQSQIDTVTGAAFIILTATDSNGFFDIDTIQVSASIPTVDLGPDSIICPGDTLLLTADSSTAYTWQDNSTNQTFEVTTGGQFHVTLTDSVGCQVSDTVNVTLAIPPVLDLGPDTSVCAGEAVVLDAGTGPVNTTYNWNFGATSQVVVVSTGGTYIASVVTPGGCAAIDTVEVINFPTPGVSLGLDRVECGPYVLDAGPGNTIYSWSNSQSTQSISLNQAGTYSVTVTNSDGCSQADTVNITMGSPPPVNLGGNQILCNGQNLTLDAGNPGSTYFWSTGDMTQTIQVSSPGVYIAVVTNASGCEGSDTINVTGSLLSVDLGPDLTICGNGGVPLDAGNPGLVYNWSTGANSQQIFVSTPGNYTVTVTDPLGCDAIDQINVAQVPGITAGINAPNVGALLQPMQFNDATTPAANAWIWDFGDGTPLVTQQNPQHIFGALGTYTVTLISTDGVCRDTITTTVDINSVVGVAEELGASSFELYPNPSNGIFNLSFELYRRQEVDIEVMDLSGKVLLRKEYGTVQQFRDEIDLGNMSNGIYFLKVSAGPAETYQKLILH